jgi:hypothetical protein
MRIVGRCECVTDLGRVASLSRGIEPWDVVGSPCPCGRMSGCAKFLNEPSGPRNSYAAWPIWRSSPLNFGCHTIRRSESIGRPSASTPLCSQRSAWIWTSTRIPWHAVSIARRKSSAHSVAARTEREVTHVDAGGKRNPSPSRGDGGLGFPSSGWHALTLARNELSIPATSLHPGYALVSATA